MLRDHTALDRAIGEQMRHSGAGQCGQDNCGSDS